MNAQEIVTTLEKLGKPQTAAIQSCDRLEAHIQKGSIFRATAGIDVDRKRQGDEGLTESC